jgi:hypothetical protein
MTVRLASVLLLAAFAVAPAQDPAHPAVHLIAAPDARTAPMLATPVAVRALRGGALLVNDTRRRQLLRFDASLANATIVADSSAGAMTSYGPRAGGIIPFVADSTLFIDPVGLSMFVIDASGHVARVASIPRSQDAPALASSSDPAGVDIRGRLVYRAPMRMPQAIGAGVTAGESPDSIEVVRLDPRTRRLDTAAYVRLPKVRMSLTQTEKGMSLSGVMNPAPMIDGWTVLSDGTIAIVRGLDYHVDFIDATGGRSGPKVPFEWQHLTDDAKVAYRDSIAKLLAASGPTQPGAPQAAIMMMHGGGGGGGGGHGGDGIPTTMTLVPANELPDYLPAFGSSAVLADADAHLWVRTSLRRATVGGGPIYDVIDREGRLIDRLQVPSGRQVIGFAPGGIVYLVARDASGAWIERTHR